MGNIISASLLYILLYYSIRECTWHKTWMRYLTKLHICARSIMSDSSWSFGLKPTRVLSMGFFRQEYLSELPFLPAGTLPKPGFKPTSPAFPELQTIYSWAIEEALMATHSGVLFPGKSHGWRSLVGYSAWGCKESDMTEWLRFHIKHLSKTYRLEVLRRICAICRHLAPRGKTRRAYLIFIFFFPQIDQLSES